MKTGRGRQAESSCQQEVVVAAYPLFSICRAARIPNHSMKSCEGQPLNTGAISRLKQALGRQRTWEIKAACTEPLTRKMVWDLAVQAEKSHSDFAACHVCGYQVGDSREQCRWSARHIWMCKTAYLCPVRAALRIQKRAERIQHPLGLLDVSSAGLIAKHDATKHLCACATQVFSYTNKTDLEKCTLRSIRVGACVLLYKLGKSATFIKDRLRWRSDSFMDFLRDTPCIATLYVASL